MSKVQQLKQKQIKLKDLEEQSRVVKQSLAEPLEIQKQINKELESLRVHKLEADALEKQISERLKKIQEREFEIFGRKEKLETFEESLIQKDNLLNQKAEAIEKLKNKVEADIQSKYEALESFAENIAQKNKWVKESWLKELSELQEKAIEAEKRLNSLLEDERSIRENVEMMFDLLDKVHREKEILVSEKVEEENKLNEVVGSSKSYIVGIKEKQELLKRREKDLDVYAARIKEVYKRLLGKELNI